MKGKTSQQLKWLEKAKEDEQSLRVLLSWGGAFSTVCFLSQQMAEKVLKAYLLFLGIEFLKIHDLSRLVSLGLEKDQNIYELQTSCVLLNRLYIEARYPSEQPPFSKKDAQNAFDAALKIKEYVLASINHENE
jgi:HEPN domain-containing protein